MTSIIQNSNIALAIAGGGNKAIYALGVVSVLKEWGIKIKEISGVSAGASIAVIILSETEERCGEYFEQLTKRNPSNFRPFNLIKFKRPFPHENIYRRLIRYSIDMEKIKNSNVKIFIHAVRAFPRKENKLHNYIKKIQFIPSALRAILLDDRDNERGIKSHRVPNLMKKWNFEEVVFTEKDFTSPEAIEQIIMMSSAIPIVFSFQKSDGMYYLDGGLTNNLLLEHFSPELKKIAIYYEKTTLVNKDLNNHADTFFIKSSQKIPIQKLDYTNPIGAKETYELGRKDTIELKDKIIEFLNIT